MPYELTFTKPVETPDREQYWNDCCVGGDIVLNSVLPALRQRYGELHAVQEDWGWFVWFNKSTVKLAIDVFCENPETGEFRMHLTSRVSRILFGSTVTDTPELEELRESIVFALTSWLQHAPTVMRLNAQYNPAT